MSLPAWENQDWITEYGWNINDGRHRIDPSAYQIDWIGDKTPLARFYKLNIPAKSILYQERLRKEIFEFYYQIIEEDNLYPLGKLYGSEPYSFIFDNDFSKLAMYRKDIPHGRRDRVGQQSNHNYPLVGIWGRLPYLTEYRLVDFTDCIYYMEIDREIPDYAVRCGTYLLRQVGDKIFETISSFPDGEMRLEIINERFLVFTPLFDSLEEDGWIAPLEIRRIPWPMASIESALFKTDDLNNETNEAIKENETISEDQHEETSSALLNYHNIDKKIRIILFTILTLLLIIICFFIIKKKLFLNMKKR